MWVKLQISLQKSHTYKSDFPYPKLLLSFKACLASLGWYSIGFFSL